MLDWRLIAWCISLEGSIGLMKDGSVMHPTIKLYNTDASIVTAFHELVGVGHIYKNKTNGSNPQNKPLYFWRACVFSEIEMILNGIVEYLPSKKEQAKLLIEFIGIRNTKKDQWHKRGSSYSDREKEIYIKMKNLNSRGLRDD